MLDAINGLNRPRAIQNNNNNGRPNQAKAVRTPSENVDNASFDETQDQSFDVVTEGQISRQDHVKILKLANKKQLSLLKVWWTPGDKGTGV